MDTGSIRDLAIIIFCVVVSIVAVFFAVIMYSFYRRWTQMQETAMDVLEALKSISHGASEIFGPLMQSAVILQGINKVVDLVMSIFNKRREKSEQ
jgi:hypothetical protein